jgi:hypothetical protein
MPEIIAFDRYSMEAALKLFACDTYVQQSASLAPNLSLDPVYVNVDPIWSEMLRVEMTDGPVSQIKGHRGSDEP